MTDEQRRFMKAKQKVVETHLNPITELLGSCADMIAKMQRERDQAVTTMEVLRPVWAMGYTDDSMAAQASANALSEIWKALGVNNQTQAMAKIRELNA